MLSEQGRREDASHKLDLNFSWFTSIVVHNAQYNKMKAGVPYVTKDFFVFSCTLEFGSYIVSQRPSQITGQSVGFSS